MKVVMVSNYLNHHQLPFCSAMQQLTDGNFTFVATTRTPKMRLDIGYHDMNEEYAFVINDYMGIDYHKRALHEINSADMVIFGSAPQDMIEQRINANGLTFNYSERLYKQGYLYLFAPKRRKAILEKHLKYKEKNVYMLCASYYTAGDLALNGAYKGKCFKWGYFPEVKQYDLDDLFAKKRMNKTVSILWAGRLIGLKHPDVSILLADKLKKEGFVFELNIIGSGELESKLKQMIDMKTLNDCVHLLGSMSPEEVREHMEKADIYLFTSDYHEGWGAVLNESMNSGCAVVASKAIGSAGFLLDPGINGYIYDTNNLGSLYKTVKKLMNNSELRENVGRAAYMTLYEMWNPQNAASRLLELGINLLEGKSTPFSSGPCSIAETRFGGTIYSK